MSSRLARLKEAESEAQRRRSIMERHIGHMVIYQDILQREGRLLKVCDEYVWLETGNLAHRVSFSQLRECECNLT